MKAKKAKHQCGDPNCKSCVRMLQEAELFGTTYSDETLGKMVDEVLLDVPLHSRKTSILVAVQKRLLESK